MKQEALKALAEILNSNLGNKITLELANGMMMALGNALPEPEAPSTQVESDKL
jgi:hypothetical protein